MIRIKRISVYAFVIVALITFTPLANGIMFGYAAVLLSTLGAGFVGFKHLVLRLLLWRSGYIPWNYARFLDYAAERIFLQKVGGGYIFVHRTLLEHFAQMNQVSRVPISLPSRQITQTVAQAKTRTQNSSRNIRNTTPQSSKPVQIFTVCRNCDHRNPNNGKFCTKCGRKLSQGS